MPRHLTRNDLRAMAETSGEPCVSMFMPIDNTGMANEQDRLRLKNLVNEAEEKLINYGVRGAEARRMLEQVRRLHDDPHIWQQQGRGLAIFRSAEVFEVFPLPIEFGELLIVTDRFELKPLLPLFIDDGRFFVLAVSLDTARLLEGTRETVREIPLRNLPPSVREILAREQPEWDLDFHAGASLRQANGKEAVIFHGHGSDTKDKRAKAKISDYTHRIADSVQPHIVNERAPLVLACVEYLDPIVRDSLEYPNITDEFIRGHPDRYRLDELRALAWEIVEPIFQRARREAADGYAQLSGQGSERAANRLADILEAASNGRVAMLFAPRGEQKWGRFADGGAGGMIEAHDHREPGDQDLLGLAATRALLTDAQVFVVPREELPDPSAELVAIYRY